MSKDSNFTGQPVYRQVLKLLDCEKVVTMIRLTLMYYIDFISFMENPDRTWENILAKEAQKGPPLPTLFD